MAASSDHPSSHWLNPSRVTAYAIIALVVMGGVLATSMTRSGPDAGDARTSDVVAFWAASQLMWQGEAVSAYDLERISAVQRDAIPTLAGQVGWYYPPPFFLAVAPLGLISFEVAYLIWMVATLALLLTALYPLMPMRAGWVMLAGFTAIWVNMLWGQNGFLTAAILAACLYHLPKRPLLAGIIGGCLVMKPQLALLLPFALIAGGYWRGCIAMGLSATMLCLISGVILGWEVWEAFIASTAETRRLVEEGLLPLAQMTSLFSLLLSWEVEPPIAYGVHGVVAFSIALCCVLIWRSRVGMMFKVASLLVATVLVTPFIYHYDLCLLAPAALCLWHHNQTHGWLRWEREYWLLLSTAPLMGYVMGDQLGLQPTSLLLLGAYLCIIAKWRRALAHTHS